MALFGAPAAREDDPERAVRAALAIRDYAREDGPELRVGITTGEALISTRCQPGAGEGMASGDVVNTAARLQAQAPVNGVLSTRRPIDRPGRRSSYRADRGDRGEGQDRTDRGVGGGRRACAPRRRT